MTDLQIGSDGNDSHPPSGRYGNRRRLVHAMGIHVYCDEEHKQDANGEP